MCIWEDFYDDCYDLSYLDLSDPYLKIIKCDRFDFNSPLYSEKEPTNFNNTKSYSSVNTKNNLLVAKNKLITLNQTLVYHSDGQRSSANSINIYDRNGYHKHRINKYDGWLATYCCPKQRILVGAQEFVGMSLVANQLVYVSDNKFFIVYLDDYSIIKQFSQAGVSICPTVSFRKWVYRNRRKD